MNDKTLKIISKVVIWTLLPIGIVLLLLFFFGGGDMRDIAGEQFNVPRFTDELLCGIYGYVLLAVIFTLIAVVISLVMSFRENAKAATKRLVIILVFFGFLAACMAIASPEMVNIVGYEGTDNVGWWARISEGTLYAIYVLAPLTLVLALFGLVYAKLKK